MLIYSETNDWGEVVYLPTTLGKVLLVVLFAALLALAVFIAQRRNAHTKEQASQTVKPSRIKLTAKQLCFCAMAVALGTVLSNIKVFSFPTGGSITLLSMLVICLPGYFFGLGAGVVTGVAYGVLQLLIDPYVLYPMQLIVDYLLAFGALGLSGLFSQAKNGLIKGYLAAILGRYVFAVLSGWIFFGSYAWEGWGALPYSLVYNAIYIFAEAAVTLVILAIPAVRDAMVRVKQMSLE